jgi:hypothetical protein
LRQTREYDFQHAPDSSCDISAVLLIDMSGATMLCAPSGPIKHLSRDGIDFLPQTVVIPVGITLPYPKISAETQISITAIASKSSDIPAGPA